MRDGFTQQRLHVFDQRMHAGPDLEHFLQHLAGKRVALLTPVVLRGFGLALLLVGLGSGLVGLLALVGFGLSGSSDVPRLVVVLAVFGGGGVAGVVGGVRMLGRPTRSTRRPRSI